MADFAPGGFSTGFARGAGVRQNQQALKLQSQQIAAQDEAARAAALEQAAERLTNAYETSETSAQKYFESQIETITAAAQQGANPEQMEALSQLALQGPMRHAEFVAGLRGQAQALGATPDMLALIPDPVDFMQLKQDQLAATMQVAQLIANRPTASTQFFGDVEGVGQGVRVTSRIQPDQSFKFFVGDQEVPAASITQPIQQTTEVSNLQIPGLTPAQSGSVIEELRQAAGANNAFATIANRVVRQVQGQPEKIGLVGTVLRGLDVISAQADAVASLFGLDSRIEGDIGDFNFRDLAGESQEVKTRLLDLVFLNLAAKGQTGRAVSDRDLQIFMDATGFGTGSPQRIASGLESAIEDNRIGLQQAILNRGGGTLRETDIIQGGFVPFERPEQPDVAAAQDLLRRAGEAAASGNYDEAARLLDELDALNGSQ